MNIGIVCGCLPILSPLIERFRRKRRLRGDIPPCPSPSGQGLRRDVENPFETPEMSPSEILKEQEKLTYRGRVEDPDFAKEFDASFSFSPISGSQL